MDNHYTALNVAMDAPDAVVRAAYRALAAHFHPDRHGHDAAMLARMQQVTAAYRVLSDPQRRAEHDAQLRRAWRRRASDVVQAASVGADPPPLATDAREAAMQERMRALRRRHARAAADYAATARLG